MKTDALFAQELRAMTDAELHRPQPDLDLVEAYVAAILELDNIEPETDEEVRAGIENVLQKSPNQRTRRRLRRVLIAVVAAVLITAMSISMTPLGTSDESLLDKWFPILVQKEPGYRKDFGDYITLIKGGKSIDFKSIRQFVRKTGSDILVPTVLPDGCVIRHAVITFDYMNDSLSVQFETDDPKVHVTAKIGKSKNENPATRTETES